MLIILYLIVIVVANIVTAILPPISFWIFIVPMGTFFVGFAFLLRDYIQMRVGKRKTYQIILFALVLSGATSILVGDMLWITFASALTFVVSESIDTEVFSRIKTSFTKRVVISGVIGGVVDSSVFVIIGLSPLGAGIIGWNMVPYAILGQVVVKSAIQFAVVFVVRKKIQEAIV